MSLISEVSTSWTKANGRQRIEILKAAGVTIPATVTETHSTYCRNLTNRDARALLDEIILNPDSDRAKAYREYRQGNEDAKFIETQTLEFSKACSEWGEMRAVSCVWDNLHPDQRNKITAKKWTLRPELDKSEIDALCAALQALKA